MLASFSSDGIVHTVDLNICSIYNYEGKTKKRSAGKCNR
jgi:hypothetical protein